MPVIEVMTRPVYTQAPPKIDIDYLFGLAKAANPVASAWGASYHKEEF
ncbi:hypothetical protein VX159_07485 [Dechloromonas sp. ZY10]